MTRLTNFVILSYSLLDDDDNLFTARGKKPCFSWLLPCKQHLFTDDDDEEEEDELRKDLN